MSGPSEAAIEAAAEAMCARHLGVVPIPDAEDPRLRIGACFDCQRATHAALSAALPIIREELAQGILTASADLTDCDCGHSIGEHNGLGCYARLSYHPLVTCDCSETDDRIPAEMAAENAARIVRGEGA